MYVPAHFTADPAAVTQLLAGQGAADLVTPTADGLIATFLPFLYEPGARPDAGGPGSLVGHVARNNPHWQAIPTGESLVILHGPDAYITPSWYASKAEHGRVVPTWNYLTAHVHGQLVVHDDEAWLADLVTRLTDRHEERAGGGWQVADAPERFIAGQLRAIVGVELVITRIEAKAKLSQNRPEADIDGVVTGLTARGDVASAEAVSEFRPSR